MFLLLQDANAACEKPVQQLIENQPSPCTGYLFSEEAERSNRLKLIDNTFQLKEIEQLNSIVDNQKQQIDSYDISIKSYGNQVHELQNEKRISDFEKILYFFAGVATTVLVEKALHP